MTTKDGAIIGECEPARYEPKPLWPMGAAVGAIIGVFRPLPPEVLADAIQDRIHPASGRLIGARPIKPERRRRGSKR